MSPTSALFKSSKTRYEYRNSCSRPRVWLNATANNCATSEGPMPSPSSSNSLNRFAIRLCLRRLLPSAPKKRQTHVSADQSVSFDFFSSFSAGASSKELAPSGWIPSAMSCCCASTAPSSDAPSCENFSCSSAASSQSCHCSSSLSSSGFAPKGTPALALLMASWSAFMFLNISRLEAAAMISCCISLWFTKQRSMFSTKRCREISPNTSERCMLSESKSLTSTNNASSSNDILSKAKILATRIGAFSSTSSASSSSSSCDCAVLSSTASLFATAPSSSPPSFS
mmetsp:Transcript_9390/g.27079  ORF Transcript_9390/g.27079 Transcript_9390/m.27079 type:complete len:284 (+) Transcript_9390:838-1689(+)